MLKKTKEFYIYDKSNVELLKSSKNKACEVFVNTGCSKNYIFPPYCINNGRLAHNVSRTAIAIKATNVNILKPFLFLIISPLDK